MTLAFETDALRRILDPPSVVADVRSWSTHVGVVSDAAPDRAASFTSRTGVDLDFVASVTGESDGLGVLKRQYPTARHVFVGGDDDTGRTARSLGWEYLDIETAAEDADWRLSAESDRWRVDDTKE